MPKIKGDPINLEEFITISIIGVGNNGRIYNLKNIKHITNFQLNGVLSHPNKSI